MTYRAGPGRVVLVHTETAPEFEGRGIASRLAQAALDDIRGRGLKVVPACPFVSSWIRRHPEYQAMVIGTQGTRAE